MKKLMLALAFVLVLAGCNGKRLPELPVEEFTPAPTENAYIEYTKITLYFPDGEAMYLHGEEHQLQKNLSDTQKAVEIVNMLFDGPKSDDLYPSLRGEKCVNSAVISDGTCTVDFSSDFVSNNTGGSAQESFAIGSIVNSLCELDSVERVKINIDGNENATFGGHFTLEAPFEKNSFSHVMPSQSEDTPDTDKSKLKNNRDGTL